MRKQDIIKKLNSLGRKSNPSSGKYIDLEIIHSKADGLLLEYIHDKEINKSFNKIRKWYA